MKSGKRALSRCWWLAFLVVLSFVFVAASECEQTSDDGQGRGSGQPDVPRIVSAVPGATAEAEGVRVTLNEIIDPWLSDTFMQPDPGRRSVAFDVTIQHVDGGTQSVSAFDFMLSDAEDFLYNATFGPDPILDSIDLGSGQKTRGWVAFEVNEGTPLKLLKYDPNVFTAKDIEFQFPAPSPTVSVQPSGPSHWPPDAEQVIEHRCVDDRADLSLQAAVAFCECYFDSLQRHMPYTGNMPAPWETWGYPEWDYDDASAECGERIAELEGTPVYVATPPPVVYVEGGPVPATGGEGTYTVEAGDTVYAIAQKLGITVEELASANNMTVEQIAQLSVGRELIIPQRAPEQQPVTTTPETGEPAAATTPEVGEPAATTTPTAGEEGTYTVQEGDIPVTIAEKFGISVEALLEANGITDPTSLKLGQVLVIPTPTATASR